MKKWVAITIFALAIFAAVVGIAYRRQILTEDQRLNLGRYYLSSETRAILNRSDKFVLLSVDPTPLTVMGEFGGATPKAKELALTNGAPEPKGSEEFHDHRVLGRIEITDAKRKNDLLAELYRGVENSQASPAACFNPRHGVVAVQGTNRVQLLICFECDQGTEFSESGQKWFSIGKEPRELFDRTLTEAGVPLAKH